jgi:hypothetical protein
MNRQQEASMAAALWAYIERAREQEGGAPGLEELTPGDIAQLVALFRTAADLPSALEPLAPEGNEAAGDRVRAAIAARSGRPSATGFRFLDRLPRLTHAAGRWVAAGAVALALGAGFAAGRALPPRPPLEAALPGRIGCREARAQFAALIEGRLPDAEKQKVLWHLAKCGSCLDAYYEAKSHHPHQRTSVPGPPAGRSQPGVRLARRGASASRL